MKLLLDTHIILWAVSQPERLSMNVAAELTNESNELWFSPISIWEIFLLAEKRRIILKTTSLEFFKNVINELCLIEAPLTWEAAVRSRLINLSHQDPADRFIAATAIFYGLKLVTSDEILIKSQDIAVIPNR